MEGKKLENLDKTNDIAYYFIILSFIIAQNMNILKLQISITPLNFDVTLGPRSWHQLLKQKSQILPKSAIPL